MARRLSTQEAKKLVKKMLTVPSKTQKNMLAEAIKSHKEVSSAGKK